MGTNYYAEWNPHTWNADAPASLTYPYITVRLHICKSLNSFQGSVFNSWSAWKNFLTRNEHGLRIVDEYNVEHAVADFIRDVEAVTPERRSAQYRWLVDNHYLLENEWICLDGYSFSAGEFS